MPITTSFRKSLVSFYSYEEWVSTEDWNMFLALGTYSSEENMIRVLKDLKGLKEDPECPEPYRNLQEGYVKCIIIHEYTHMLQWKMGKGINPLPIFPVGKIPITKFIKQIYSPENWAIEAEAMWMESHPHMLNELEALVEASLNPTVEESLPLPPFKVAFWFHDWKVEDTQGDTWVWSPVWERWEPEQWDED